MSYRIEHEDGPMSEAEEDAWWKAEQQIAAMDRAFARLRGEGTPSPEEARARSGLGFLSERPADIPDIEDVDPAWERAIFEFAYLAGREDAATEARAKGAEETNKAKRANAANLVRLFDEFRAKHPEFKTERAAAFQFIDENKGLLPKDCTVDNLLRRIKRAG